MSLAQFTKQELVDMSLVDMAYAIIESNNKQTVAFTEIMDIIVAATGKSQSEVRAKIAQFYTDMNIDGRFLCMGDNRWGLRSWYPVEQAEEDTITQIKPKKAKKKKLKDEDDDYEDDDLDYDDLDEFEDDDLLDDEEEIFDEIDEDEDLLEDDEELIDEDEELIDEIDVVDDELVDDEEEEEDDLTLDEEDDDL
ncbi:DNA-directed RNA polymerase subunit delta [Pseudoneobacillus rhizosphaerae]|uniref:Probable DNA-directed RNA polymerase subunit delta n=1 Tax=Pseudoneobacillus rhizosphaerae TaxID=2880968 RepID=A0A9C7G6P3_9BACI|nr:DNA-directed RNA polymerase subunit delta [Pseudoneobacillus rhizosphaerae]CAG9606703.1 DNA-directed RNA polymerase subunit delta [Pseudoneobacillus rhizosphaerae]